MDNSELFERLGRSTFRSGFSLKQKDFEYIEKKGMDTIRQHAADFVSKNLAPAYIPNDGKQTPTKGHPVFPAQHATACCCRGCLEKWHRIPKGLALTEEQQNYVVEVLMQWIERQLAIGPKPEKKKAVTKKTTANKTTAKKQAAESEDYEQLTLPFL